MKASRSPRLLKTEVTSSSAAVPQWRRQDPVRYGDRYATQTDLVRQFSKAAKNGKRSTYDPWLENPSTSLNEEHVETLDHIGVVHLSVKNCRLDTETCAFDDFVYETVIENFTMERDNVLEPLEAPVTPEAIEES